MTARTVAVLGGGVGGLVAANRLRQLLPARDRVVLVTREQQHVFQPSLLWVASGSRRPREIQRPIAKLARKGIDVVTADVTRIDALARTITTTSGSMSADALIVSLGAELAPETIPGLSDGGHNLYTLEGATALHEELLRVEGGRVVVLTAAPAYKCPAAPYEAAMLMQSLLHRRGVSNSVRVELYAAEPGPMGVAGPTVSAAVRGMVEASGIHYFPEHQVTTVDAASRRLSFSNGTRVHYDVLAFVPPHRAPAVVKESRLTSESGWIAVNRSTFETAWPMVFAIGDVTSVPLSIGKPLPKAGVFAHAQAEVVAHNLTRAWTGRGSARHFDGHGRCFLETGGGRAGLGSGNFYGEPSPQVELHPPAVWWHWSKVFLEYAWLRRWL